MKKIIVLFALMISALVFSQDPTNGPSDPIARNAKDVSSIYNGIASPVSPQYTNEPNIIFNDLGGCNIVGPVTLNDGNTVMKYTNHRWSGIQLGSVDLDVSAMTTLHIDVYSPGFTAFAIKLESSLYNGSFTALELEVPGAHVQGTWNSYDIDLSTYVGVDLAHLKWIVPVTYPGSGETMYIDNVYFYKPIGARKVALNGTSVPSGQQILNTTDGVNYTKESVTFLNAGTGHFNELASNLNPSGPYGDWSSPAFSNGTGTAGGADIAIQPGTYNVSLNISTGIYTFTPITVSVIGDFNSWAGDIDFSTTDNITFSKLNYTFITGGGLKFRDNHNWVHNIGSPTNPSPFPSGTAADMDGGPNINYTAGTFDITFNRTTLQYNFKEHKAYNDQISVLQGATATSLITNAASVLANDTFASNSTAVLVSAPTNGTLLFNNDGTFSYTHNNSKILSDSFTYKDYDGISYSNIAAVTINVTEVNINTPTNISLSNATINENLNTTSIGNLSATDLDSNNVFTYSLVSGNGDLGNSNFAIVNGNQLRNVTPFDFETQSSYSIRVKVDDGAGHNFEKIFTINVMNVNDIAIIAAPINSYCSGSISINTVTNTSGVVHYSWTASNGGVVQPTEQNTASITNLANGTYTITITDDYSPYSQSFNIATLPQYQNTSVCYVTSDETDVTKNRIFINNQGNYNVGFYEVLRETNISNYYSSIGTITPSEISFLDLNSDNTSKAYRYKVRLVDNCANPSTNSAFHKTILLQSTVAINNSVSLSWTNYEGITYGTYNIYRKTNLGAFELIGSIASTDNAYNDQTANVLMNKYEYYVAIDVSSCATSAAGKIKATSAIKSNLQKLGNSLSINTSMLSSEIILYPNPSSSKVVLEIPESIQFSELEIYNTLGQKIKSIKEKEFSVEFLPTGTYLIKIFTDQGIAVKNFIKV